MKKSFFFVLGTSLLLMFVSCASAPSAGVQNEKKQNAKKLRYDDWKYMGFGYEIPLWVEPALNGDIEKVKKVTPALAEKDIQIFVASGVSIDQAEEVLAEQFAGDGYVLYNSFWVRVNDEKQAAPYTAVAIYVEK